MGWAPPPCPPWAAGEDAMGVWCYHVARRRAEESPHRRALLRCSRKTARPHGHLAGCSRGDGTCVLVARWQVRGRGRRGRLAVLDAGALCWGVSASPKTGRERVKSLLSRAMDGLSCCLPARALRAQIFPRVGEGRAPAGMSGETEAQLKDTPSSVMPPEASSCTQAGCSPGPC